MKGSPIVVTMIVILSLTVPTAVAGGFGSERPEGPMVPMPDDPVDDLARFALGAASGSHSLPQPAAGVPVPESYPVPLPADEEPEEAGSGDEGSGEGGDSDGGMQSNEPDPDCVDALPVQTGPCPQPDQPPQAPPGPDPGTPGPGQDQPAPPEPQQQLDALQQAVGPLPTLEPETQTGGLVNAIQNILGPVQNMARGAGEGAKVLIDEAVSTAGFVADQATDYAGRRTSEFGAFAGALVQTLVDTLRNLLEGQQSSSTGRINAASGSEAVVAPSSTRTATGVFGLAAIGGISVLLAAFAIGRKLLSLGGAALLSRIPSKDIMKNDTRAAIFEIVESDPGVSLNEIVSRLGISRNAVAYHLAVFESEKTVVSVKDGKYRRYFVNGGKYVNGAKDVVSTIKNDVTLTVIRYIMHHPGAMQKEVCEAVGTSPSATNWHINRLEKVGLVAKEKVANTVRYSPGPSFQKYDLQEFGLAGAMQPMPIAA